MKVDVISIFPGLFEAFLAESFVGIAARKGLLEAETHDLRDWTHDRHRSVDDQPYGGGPGMVMTPEPLVAAIEQLAGPKGPDRDAIVVALSPQGRRLDQASLERLAGVSHLVLVCGRYEGIDQRVLELAVDEELSIGDYILSGGELPAMVVIEGLVRLLLEYGATYIHSGDGTGMCPLHLAAMQGDVALLQTLLPFADEDDLDATDGQGRTALLLATLEGHAEVVRLLLESGADAAVKDSDGSDARRWATDLAHDDICALLKP